MVKKEEVLKENEIELVNVNIDNELGMKEQEVLLENDKETFTLLNDGRIIFKQGFNYNEDIVEDSRLLFQTPLLKPYISQFARGKNKNITMANVFKVCVILDCSPNDLFNWEDWRGKVMELAITDSFSPITTNDIKGML
tara:strand:+ start:525 stop:941 length:417 start_codon:yes stop_codon:yes gene_type:complete